MPFEKMQKPEYPPRHWALVSFPGDGKSTFATQMRAPALVVDADHRFGEVVGLALGDVYRLSDNPADSVDPEAIYRLLAANMPGSGVRTVVVDSLTAIIAPRVVEAVIESDARRERNRQKKEAGRKDMENLTTPFKDKALAMRLLQDAVTRWGTDTLWIYHLQTGRDQNAQEVTRPILPATERARLYRSLNMELHIVKSADEKRRGVKVIWARQGRSGMTLWDGSGKWAGMPEKIEAAVYGGLSQAEMSQIEQAAPDIFPTVEAAIEYGQAHGAFKAVQHARNAWQKLARLHSGAAMEELSLLWIEEVERRAARLSLRAEPQAEDSPQAVRQSAQAEAGEQAPAGEPRPESAPGAGPPSFTTLEDLLFQLHLEFGLNEAEAKAKLKELGFTGWPANGGAREKSSRMYLAVKEAMEKAGPTQGEIPF